MWTDRVFVSVNVTAHVTCSVVVIVYIKCRMK